jgi:hypothetical protein
MRRTAYLVVLLGILFGVFTAGCSSPKSSGAAKAIESYLNAVVARNVDQATALACKEYADSAQTDVDSFAAVTPRLEGLACQESGQDGSATLVTCKGKIIATYNNEDQEISLEGRTYKVVQQGGEWLMCGYK